MKIRLSNTKKAFTMIELVITMAVALALTISLYIAYNNKLNNDEAYNYGRDLTRIFDAYVTNKNYGYIQFNGNEDGVNFCTTSFYYEVDNNLTMGKVKLCSKLDGTKTKFRFYWTPDGTYQHAQLCEEVNDVNNKCWDNGENNKGHTYLKTRHLSLCRAYLGSRNDQSDEPDAINNRIELFIDCSDVPNEKQRKIVEFYVYNRFAQAKDRLPSYRLATGVDRTMTYKRWTGIDPNDKGDETDGQVLIIFDLGRG